MNGRVEVRRARHLISFWREDSIVTRNYATGGAAQGDALVPYVLSLCTNWTTVATLRRQLPSMRPRRVDDLVTALISHGLLVRADRPEDPRERALDSWQHWNPEAGFFHFSTRNLPVPPRPEEAERRLIQERQMSGSPGQTKRYAHAPTFPLPPPQNGAFADVLLQRRTWRSFGRDPVTLGEIGTLLGLTVGVQRVEQSTLGPVHLKTSPSSGARQPLEAYLLSVNVDGLAPGVYHYVSDRHLLEAVKPRASARTIAKYIPGQWWYESSSAVVMFTAVFARTQWRYRFPRAYRSVLLEAGHVCQTFCLVATWLGLAPFCTGRFADSVVEKDLRIDGVSESFIYGAGVGRRPAGVDWAPLPLDRSPEHPLRRRGRRKVSPSLPEE
jgi:SagB-type dehydrogenase family enzyme